MRGPSSAEDTFADLHRTAGTAVLGYALRRPAPMISDADPTIDNRASVSLQERWRGYDAPDVAPYADRTC